MHKENTLAMPPSGAVQCRVVLWTREFCNSLMIIGKLLGYRDIETTARYAHLARASLYEAAERVAGSIAGDIL